MNRIVVVSPHIDDAILSMGGTIYEKRMDSADVLVEYIFSISNWCNEELFPQSVHGNDVSFVTSLRKAEENIVQQQVQHRYDYLDFLDHPLRNGLDETKIEKMKREIRTRLTETIDRNDICVFPLGLQHPDHVLIREIGVEMHKDNYNVFFYEDMPYMADSDYNFHEFDILLQGLGLSQFCRTIDIEKKKSILKSYSSQVAPGWIKDIVNYSYNVTDNKFYERFWKPVTTSFIF